MTDTMRAAIFNGNGQVDIVECPRPDPGRGQVRVRIDGCGVCGSNLPVFEGRPWFQYPLEPGTPGHEGWGTIDAVGADLSSALLGRRVAMLSNHAYAEWDVADAANIVPIPDSLADAPVPGEPLACAVNVMKRAGIHPADTVVVIGVGFLGSLIVRLATHAGADVIAISRRPWALDLARQLGARVALPFCNRNAIVHAVKEHTAGRMADCVIEAIGSQSAIDLASDLTRVRGRLVIAGYHQDGPRQINMQDWNWRGLDVINAHERDEEIYVRGMTEAIILLRCGVIDLHPLLTHRLPFEDLGQAFALMQQRPDGFLKASVTFGGGSAGGAW
jgi:threonine dehydrogenase-like Zn-dependent dehydrogenase